jgi:uncharacterized protein
VTLLYFVLLSPFDEKVQQGAYAVGKVLQFAFPAVWVFLICRERFRLERPRWAGVAVGFFFGLAILLVMLAFYHGWLKPAGFFERPAEKVQGKVQDLGLDTLAKYAATGVFYALFHSFLEEYYWRWFVFGRLRRHTTYLWAAGISGFGFMAHHVVLLGVYFEWQPFPTCFFSLCVAIGGLAWAGIFQWSRSLLGPWLSHALVDMGIFVLGYDLVRHMF